VSWPRIRLRETDANRRARLGWAPVNGSRIRPIYRKDMRDALRDSRVLTALIMPLLLGLLYSFIFTSDVPTQKVKVGIVSPDRTELTTAISKLAPAAVRVTFVTMTDPIALERQVQRKKLDVGLVLPAGFDDQVRAGSSPVLTTLLPSSSSFGGDYVAAMLDRSVQTMAGHLPAARVVQQKLPPDPGGGGAIDTLGVRRVFILISIILLLTMIAVYAVPAVLIEETEKKTMDALTLIASTAEVIAAKAQFGVTLSVVSVPVLLALTRGRPKDVVALIITVLLSAAVLVGIGLLFAGLLKNQQQVNTWSGLVLMALLAPAFTIGLSVPDSVNTALSFLPTVHTFRLLANAFTGRTLYPNAWVSYVALAAWGAAAYGLVWWRLSRQEE
jgi:ABC-2 type transport system permease protein